MIFQDGEVYEGEWRDDKNHGKGLRKLANGNVYDGDFEEDRYHGVGTYTWADGIIYTGTYRTYTAGCCIIRTACMSFVLFIAT